MLNDPFRLPKPLSTSIDALRSAVEADTTYQAVLATSGNNDIFRISDIGPGSSVRVGETDGSFRRTLAVQRSLTKENTPFSTRRTVIRLNDIRVEGGGSPRDVTRSAYLVIVSPDTGNYQTVPFELAQQLCHWALFGSLDADEALTNESDLARVLAGEP